MGIIAISQESLQQIIEIYVIIFAIILSKNHAINLDEIAGLG